MKLPDTAAMALRELDAVCSRVETLGTTDFARPTALPGWSVEHLVRHLAEVAFRQGEAYHRAVLSIGESPNAVSVAAPLDQLPRVLRSAAEHVARGTQALVAAPAEPVVPLPFASLPPSFAGFVLLVEYGVHRYDLENAVTGAAGLPSDVSDVIADLLAVTLPSLASNVEPSTRSIRLEPDGRSPTTLSWADGRWLTADEAEVDTVVRGSAEALALFVLGRIPVEDARLGVTDPTGAVESFKTMFPGP